jgi:hypothetical protein
VFESLAEGWSVVGLSTEELQTIRGQVGAGRKPRVQFTDAAGQIAGQVGQVVELTDPAASDEWVVVRFGRDELPFSPGDLQVAPRGAAAKKVAAPPAPEEPARPEPEFVIDKPLPVPTAPVPRKGGDEVPAPAARKPASRPAKAKPGASLTVTLAYAEGEWTLSAAQGSKALAKPYVIRPAEAMKMVQLVDVPGVQEAVEHILGAERAEAQAQADKLRAELAEVEARLAELGEAG